MPAADPDAIDMRKIRYLASFLAPPDAVQGHQNTLGRPQDPPAVQFQAYVSIEGQEGLELLVAEQKQAHAVYLISTRWSLKALGLKPSWQMTVSWPGATSGAPATTRTFELQEPPRDMTGGRRKLWFKVKERVSG